VAVAAVVVAATVAVAAAVAAATVAVVAAATAVAVAATVAAAIATSSRPMFSHRSAGAGDATSRLPRACSRSCSSFDLVLSVDPLSLKS
jgi:hypothetical protein